MTLRERLIARFGSWEKIPPYLRAAVELREGMRARSEAAAAARAERLKREEEARVALMGPPARVWRIGRVILWDPPEHADQVAPECYRIHTAGGVLHGDWTGDPHAREAQLLGDAPASVEAMYPDTGLNLRFISPSFAANPQERGRDGFAVGRARYAATRGDHRREWRRVLAGFGVTMVKIGVAGGPLVRPLDPPMTSAEAECFARGGDPDWINAARILRRLEIERGGSLRADRMGRIVDSCRTFEGRRTRDGRPWVRPLRKHAEIPDITRAERDAAARSLQR